MKLFFAACILAFSVGACGGGVYVDSDTSTGSGGDQSAICKGAAKHILACTGQTIPPDDCDTQAVCRATCVIGATCQAVADNETGNPQTADGQALAACVLSC